MSLEEKREAARDFESDAKRRRGDDSNSDVSRDDSLDMFYNTPGDSKDGEDFFPLAKKSDRKKRQYRGMAEDNSMSEKKERSDREHRRERSNKDRRERDLPSSRGWGESDGRERSGRSSGRRSPYSRSHRDRGRHRDRDRYDRDGDSYRRDDWSQGGDRDSRRGLDRDRLRVNRDREDQHGSSASSGRNKRSPYMEEPGQHSRRHRREERGERDRERRNVYQDRERKWRGSRPVSDHSAVERRVSGSETSDNSGEEEDHSDKRGRRVELRPESIENLIRDLEERRRFTGDSGSEVSSGSSTHSDRLQRGSNIHYEDGQLSPGSRSGSGSSGESGRSYNGSNRRHGRPYSLSPRSRSRSPIGNHENSMPGHPMRSKFDSTEYSGDEAGDGVLGDGRGILSHPERTDSEELAVTGEHKNTNDQEIENERLSAQFVKDIEEEELGEMDGVFGDLPIYYPALMGCRNVETYEWLNRIEEGTYGVVHRGKDKRTGEIVALKKLKMEKEREGFPITSLREINMLLKAKHPNIVHVKEIVVGSNMDKIFIVMEYVEHDLKNLMESMSQPFRPGEVKTLTRQLLSAVNHLHDNWILHRDLKASNLLLSHKGILKVGDFGLAREYGSPLKPYTPVVVTLWYRCPELLLGEKEYSTAVDMWSVGCIFAEFIQKEPLFKGRSEIDMLNLIFKELGTPSERIWPGYNKLPTVEKVTFTNHPFNVLRKKFPVNVLSENGFELLNRFLTYDPKKRVNAYDAMQHQYFKEPPMPIPPSMFPTWPAKSERTKTATKREKSPKPPSGGQNNIFNNDDDKIGPGFNLKMNP